MGSADEDAGVDREVRAWFETRDWVPEIRDAVLRGLEHARFTAVLRGDRIEVHAQFRSEDAVRGNDGFEGKPHVSTVPALAAAIAAREAARVFTKIEG